MLRGTDEARPEELPKFIAAHPVEPGILFIDVISIGFGDSNTELSAPSTVSSALGRLCSFNRE